MVEIKIKKDPGATLPKQAHKNDVAFDLFTNEEVIVVPGMLSATIVKTGLHMQFDAEKYGLLISPRSSMVKLPLTLANSTGIVEGTFTGDVGIALRNVLHHETAMWDTFALTLSRDTGAIERVPVADISTEVLEAVKQRYLDQVNLLFSDSMKDLTEELKDAFVTRVPHGTLFIPKGTRLAQAYIIPRFDVEFIEVAELEETERGNGGFGSSGSH